MNTPTQDCSEWLERRAWETYARITRKRQGQQPASNSPDDLLELASPSHVKALKDTLRAMALLAVGLLKGRFASDLSAGAGKTTLAISMALTIDELARSEHKPPEWPEVSMAYCAGRVEELCRFLRDYLAEGGSPEQVGLHHTKYYSAEIAEKIKNNPAVARDYEEYATERNDPQAERKRILMLTHAKTKSLVDNKESLFSWQGKLRDLIIWDESLLPSMKFSMPLSSAQAIRGLSGLGKELGSDGFTQSLNKVIDCLDRLEKDTAEVTILSDPKAIGPYLSPDEAEEIKASIPHAGAQLENKEYLRQFTDILTYPLRYWAGGIGGAYGLSSLIAYRVVVPDILQSMIVLDASYAVRLLEKEGGVKHLSEAPGFEGFKGQVADYSKVIVQHLVLPGSRTFIKKDDYRVSVRLLSKIPTQNVSTLIVLFNGNGGVGSIKAFQSRMRKTKLDPDEVYNVVVNGKTVKRRRFEFATWGMTDSSNEFRHCENIFLATAFNRASEDLAGEAIAQNRELKRRVISSMIRGYNLSEKAHCSYQAICRGTCRSIDRNGFAGAMRLWIVDSDRGIKEPLEAMLPGVTWKTNVAPTDKAIASRRNAALSVTIANKIAKVLASIPESELSISSTEMKKLAGNAGVTFPSHNSKTWSKAGGLVKDYCDWKKVGRTYVRTHSNHKESKE